MIIGIKSSNASTLLDRQITCNTSGSITIRYSRKPAITFSKGTTIRKTWSVEYITRMQRRTRWKPLCRKLPVGVKAIIKTGELPSLQWPVGRIIQVHPGRDGKIRVATLKIKGGEIKREANKLRVFGRFIETDFLFQLRPGNYVKASFSLNLYFLNNLYIDGQESFLDNVL